MRSYICYKTKHKESDLSINIGIGKHACHNVIVVPP